MEKKIDYTDFSAKVSELWRQDAHKYGSVQFPAREALEFYNEQGYTNAQEMYDAYRRNAGGMFTYAGD